MGIFGRKYTGFTLQAFASGAGEALTSSVRAFRFNPAQLYRIYCL
jgi:hypothetical protein